MVPGIIFVLCSFCIQRETNPDTILCLSVNKRCGAEFPTCASSSHPSVLVHHKPYAIGDTLLERAADSTGA
jgi:hypothetical protein